MTETNPPLQVIVGATSPIARAYAVDCAAAGKPLLLAGRAVDGIGARNRGSRPYDDLQWRIGFSHGV